MIAKMKSFLAFGRNRPPASLLSPSPAAEDPAEPEREQALDRVEAGPERIRPRVEQGLDPLDLVAAQPDQR